MTPLHSQQRKETKKETSEAGIRKYHNQPLLISPLPHATLHDSASTTNHRVGAILHLFADHPIPAPALSLAPEKSLSPFPFTPRPEERMKVWFPPFPDLKLPPSNRNAGLVVDAPSLPVSSSISSSSSSWLLHRSKNSLPSESARLSPLASLHSPIRATAAAADSFPSESTLLKPPPPEKRAAPGMGCTASSTSICVATGGRGCTFRREASCVD